jgi:bifunctional NMN adenylyltransferase/nudix hydrolase
MATAILIGRFQTPQIPHGLKEMIDTLIGENEHFVIIVGVNKTGATRKNPIDVALRKRMLKDTFSSIEVYDLEDHPSDEVWSEHLDKLVADNVKGAEISLYGSEDNFIRRYTGKHNVVSVGTSAGAPTAREVDEGSKELRQGIVLALQKTYPKVYPTVDVVVFRNNRSEILLGQKGIEKKWRFLGGFTDPSDESYEAAASRELKEECGLTEISSPQYEASFKVDDWRYRQEEDKIITILFSSDYISGNAVGSDDIEQVSWFSLQEVRELVDKKQTAPEHLPLFEFLLAKYLKERKA